MRIAHVADNYPPDLGGIQVVVSELAERAAVRGHEVEVFVHARRGQRSTSELRSGVVVHRFKAPVGTATMQISPGLAAALVRNRHRFDVVHVHNYHALPALAAAVAGMRPLVFSPYYHGGGHSAAARAAHVAYRPASRLLVRACAHMLFVSSAEAHAFTRDFPSAVASATVARNGVASSFAAASPFASDHGLVVAAGRLEPYKQFDRVVLAAEFLPDDMRVVLLGSGPAEPSLASLVKTKGLEERVRVLGRVPDDERQRWFKTATVLVSMSKHESFGLTVIEALAAGAPVIASDIPAHRETAHTQPVGAVRLLPVDSSPLELSREIERAAHDGLPSGVAVRSWEEMTDEVIAVYEAVS